MPTGLASTIMLDLAASHSDEQRRGARARAQEAVARRGQPAWRLALRYR